MNITLPRPSFLTGNASICPTGKDRIEMPINVIGTWSFSQLAVQQAYDHAFLGKSATSSVVKGISAIEEDADMGVYIVGRGGYPCSTGELQVDAALMDGCKQSFGAVAALEGIASPIKVAEAVMERSPHNFLVGKGAQRFAKDQGFRIETSDTLLPDSIKQAYNEHLLSQKSKQVTDKSTSHKGHMESPAQTGHMESKQVTDKSTSHKGHMEAPAQTDHAGHTDTLGLIVLDQSGNIAAGVSTSGMPYKHEGRVGDSALPGCGLYADNTAGAACCTGDGDQILRFSPAIQIVELMRQGASPTQACEAVIERIAQRVGEESMFEVAVIAMNIKGDVGAAGTVETWTDALNKEKVYDGFPYVHSSDGKIQTSVHPARYKSRYSFH